MSKFKVGDKVVRVKCSHSKCFIGYVGKVTSVRGCWVSVDEITTVGGLNPFSEDFFELYEEKQMFDMKKEPWGIFWKTHEERDAIVDWLKSQGFEIKTTFHQKCLMGSFSNLDYRDNSYGFGSGTKQDFYWWDGKAKEIKLTFKTETTITNVEYPEILTEKEIETRKIREEMEALAERLKKLEGN